MMPDMATRRSSSSDVIGAGADTAAVKITVASEVSNAVSFAKLE
jgi:hypothetical protein